MLYRRECVRVPDGGVVTLDWLHDEAAPTGARDATELPRFGSFVHLHQGADRHGPALRAGLARATRRYVSLLSLRSTHLLYQRLTRVIAAAASPEEGHGLGAVRVLSAAIDAHGHDRARAQLLSLSVRDAAAGVVALWSGAAARGAHRDARRGAAARECLDAVVRVCRSANVFTMTAGDVADAMRATVVALSRGGADSGLLRAAESCCEVHKALLLRRAQQARRCLGLLTAFSRACVGLLAGARGADDGGRVAVARALASLFSALSAHSTAVALYAAHMVADVVGATTAAAVDRGAALPPRVASALSPGVYALMDLLSAREFQMMYAALGVGRLGTQRQRALRNLKMEYEREHKYSGKV